MSFSMTTEQVGYLIIYMSITRLWLSILPLQRRNYYYITMDSVYISALRYISLLAHQVIKWYLESHVFQYAGISWHEQSFSMPTYHGMSKVSVCRHIMAWAKFQYAGITWHEQSFSMPAYQGMSKVSVCRHIMARPKFQYANISWQEQNFSTPTYHGKSKISVCQHIMASTKIPNHHLFRYASISRHSIILSVIANSGSVTYRDIDLKANKYHIFCHIRSNRVSRLSILT
jgi:hypothetical protein